MCVDCQQRMRGEMLNNDNKVWCDEVKQIGINVLFVYNSYGHFIQDSVLLVWILFQGFCFALVDRLVGLTCSLWNVRLTRVDRISFFLAINWLCISLLIKMGFDPTVIFTTIVVIVSMTTVLAEYDMVTTILAKYEDIIHYEGPSSVDSVIINISFIASHWFRRHCYQTLYFSSSQIQTDFVQK